MRRRTQQRIDPAQPQRSCRCRLSKTQTGIATPVISSNEHLSLGTNGHSKIRSGTAIIQAIFTGDRKGVRKRGAHTVSFDSWRRQAENIISFSLPPSTTLHPCRSSAMGWSDFSGGRRSYGVVLFSAIIVSGRRY